jgi:hypothetical protein
MESYREDSFWGFYLWRHGFLRGGVFKGQRRWLAGSCGQVSYAAFQDPTGRTPTGQTGFAILDL